MKDLLLRLAKNNIDVRVEQGTLRLKVPAHGCEAGILEEVKRHKEALISYISGKMQAASRLPDIQKAPVKPWYRLSAAQKRLYFLYEFDRSSVAYNIPMVVRLSGGLNKEQLLGACRKLIARHESLRTYFEVIDGEPVQKIAPAAEPEVVCIQAHEKEIPAVIRNFTRPFDLSCAPLFRLAIIELKEHGHLLVADLHHIIADGISAGILVSECLAFYKNEELPQLPFQYKDYAEWQNSEAYRQVVMQQQQFWLDEFAALPPVPELPTDFPRPLIRDHRGASVGFALTAGQTKALRSIAEKEGATLFMVTLALCNILLAKLSNQEDIIIGTPEAGRHRAELQSVFGMFVNTIPLRNYVRGQLSFTGFLSAVRAKVLSCFDNRLYQYEDLVDQLQVARDPGRNPLFDVVFSYRNREPNETEMPGPPLPFDSGYSAAKFDLTISASEWQDGLSLDFSYATALFNRTTIERFTAYFKKIVAAVVAYPQVRIAGIPVMTAAEERRVREQLHNTAAAWPREATITGLFLQQVKKHPGKIAIEYEGQTLTYRQLNQQSNQLAWWLRCEGVGAGTIVGLLTDRRPETITGMLGILKAGAAYLPVDVDYPPDRIRYMLTDSNIRILLTTHPELVHDFAGIKSICLNDERLAGYETGDPENVNAPQDLCYIIYTSGTTGHPKGVMIEHRNVVRLLFNEKFQFNFNENDVWTLFHSHCFDFSVWEMYGALLYGGKLIIVPKMVARDPLRFRALLHQKRVTVLNQTPSAFYNLADADLEQSEAHLALRYVIFGGDKLKPVKLASWAARYPHTKLINMYGITETTVHVTYKEIGPADIAANISNIGKPIPTLSCYILDRYGKTAPPGVTGELFVGGEGVARGYLNKQLLTESRFIPDPYNPGQWLYRSGDRVRLMNNGDLEYLGRIDTQLKIRGFRIEVGEIEAALLKHPAVRDAVVTDLPGKDGNAILCAWLVAKDPLQTADIRVHLGAILPDYMVPAHFVTVDSIPQTSNGKVNKSRLPLPRADEETGEGPRTPVEESLAQIWAEVLGIPPPAIHSNFFSLGGDSMVAIRLVSAINRKLHAGVSVADLFVNPTISALGKCIQQLTGSEAALSPALTIQEEFTGKKNRLLAQKVIAGKHNVEDVFPASDIQSGMLFHGLKEPGIYHDQMVHVVHYPGMDISRLEHALYLMVQKHAILRTGFCHDEQELFQVVYKKLPLPFSQTDLSGSSNDDQYLYIKNFLAADKNDPFDPESAPLWRLALFSLGNARYCICFICHHAIMDGWSDANFNTELNNIFLLLQKNHAFVPVPLKSSYKDFVIDQLAASRDEALTGFWKQELAEYIRFIFPSADRQGFYQTSSERLPGHLYAGLKTTCRQWDVPSKHVCFSAFIYALRMFSCNNDITVGMVSGNRPVKEDGEKVLGCFLNTVPVRLIIPVGITWQDYVLFVDNKLKQLKKYERLSLRRITDCIGEHAADRNPITDILFNYIDFHVYDQMQGREAATANEQKNIAGLAEARDNFLFSFTIDETGGACTCSLSWFTSYISDAAAGQFFNYFRQIISQIIQFPERLINSRQILPPETVDALLYAFNPAPDRKEAAGVIDRFEAATLRQPAGIAVVCGEKRLTYAELNRRANQLARHLIGNGSAHTERTIGVMMSRSADMVVALLGILKSGAAYVPIDPLWPPDRIRYIIRDSSMFCMVTDRAATDSLKGNAVTVVFMDDAATGAGKTEKPRLPVRQSDLAYVIYTSGTTGMPKGVMIEHGSLNDYVQTFTDCTGLGAGDVVIQQASLSFDTSVEEIFPVLCCGGKLVILKEGAANIAEMARIIESEQATILSTTPLVLNELNEIPSRLKSLRLIISGGDELKAAYITRLNNDTVCNSYGPTETTVAASFHRLRSLEETAVIGKPLPGRRMYLLNNEGQLVPPEVPGEIAIAGSGLARGYLNNPELTALKFIKDPFEPSGLLYLTGDMANRTPDGSIVFLGRKDSQIKIRGYRVEPGEIEQTLLLHAAVKECAVIAKGEGSEKYLVACYTGKKTEPAGLMQYLLQKLPAYMVPDHYFYLDKLPVTVSGKINKNALHHIEVHTGGLYVPPEGPLEEQLTAIWSGVLNIDRSQISTTRSFFELGGHSLKVSRLAFQLQHQFNAGISMADIYRYPTIKELALFLSRSNGVIRQGYEPFILLRQQPQTEDNWFFIHDGSGEVTGYIELAGLVNRCNCLGLRSSTLQRLAPANIRIADIAERYAEYMAVVQPAGPFRLAGWSDGGIIACELAARLEAIGREVAVVLVMDAQFRSSRHRKQQSAETAFSVKSERLLLQELLGTLSPPLPGASSMEELWKEAVALMGNDEGSLEKIRNIIPAHIRLILPHLRQTDMEGLIRSVNTVRTLEKAVADYRPAPALKAPLIYVKARESYWTKSRLCRYFGREIKVIASNGDHFTMLQPPHVQQLAGLIREL